MMLRLSIPHLHRRVLHPGMRYKRLCVCIGSMEEDQILFWYWPSVGHIESVELVLDVHLCIWALACVLAFLYFYNHDAYSRNPEMEYQLRCLSGIIVCDPPLFGTLMCGFGGAAVAASIGRARREPYAVVVLLLVYCVLLVIVHYDVKAHRGPHFIALGVLLVVGSLYVRQIFPSGWLLYVYFAATALFVGVVLFNVAYTKWKSPWLTVQAVVEILWVLALTTAVVAYGVGAG